MLWQIQNCFLTSKNEKKKKWIKQMTFPHIVKANKDKPSLLQGEHIPKRQTF